MGKSNSGLVRAAWASSSKDHECAIRHARKQRDGAQNTRIGCLPRRIRRSLIISGEGVGPCAVLQKASEEVAECLRRAAEAEACAEATNNAKFKAEYQRIAQTWRTLARGYEFEGSLGRFISFNESKKSVPFIPPPNRQTISKRTSWPNPCSRSAFGTPTRGVGNGNNERIGLLSPPF
jgi:hypothetical protein